MSTSATLLAATASAAASAPFQTTSERQSITVQVVGMDSTNKAYLQMWDIVAGAYVNVLFNGSAVYADANSNTIFVTGCNKYRINKDATTALVGVAVTSLETINLAV